MRRETYAILRTPRNDQENPYRGVMNKGPGGLSFDLEAATPGPEVDVEVEKLAPEEAADLRRDETVHGVARSMKMSLIEPVGGQSDAASRPADDDDRGWGVRAVGALGNKYSGRGVKVAVLDTGIDAKHPAFNGVTLIEKDFTAKKGEDDSRCPDAHGHGTHCAGTLFGRDVGGVRIGVAPGVERAMIGKVVGENGGGSTEQLYAAIDWAADQGAHIISMSLAIDFAGYAEELQQDEKMPFKLAISQALTAYRENILFFDNLVGFLKNRLKTRSLLIAAAGNDSLRDERPDFEITAGLPAATNGIIAVGALRRTANGCLEVADFSNIGVDVAAPGTAIYSAKPGGELGYNAGTSMAAPHVAGVAALWAEKLRDETGRVDSEVLSAKLIGLATRHGLVDGSAPLKIGAGLVQAPPSRPPSADSHLTSDTRCGA